MHRLFDHGPVFSVVVQIIFQTGWAIVCGMEFRYLLNERKTAWTRRNALETIATRKAAGALGEGERGGDGAKLVPE